MRGGSRNNSGRKPKYTEKTVSLSVKVPSSKKAEIIKRIDAILDTYTIKSINDLMKIGYIIECDSNDNWWLMTGDRQNVIGFESEPDEITKSEKCYSINSNGEVSAVFL